MSFELIDGKMPVWGSTESGSLDQLRRCAETAHRVALMADNHKGYGVPIGGVVAYKDAISPSAVGYDIACGNLAVRLDMPASELRANIRTIMDDIWSTISFGVGRKNNESVDHPLLERDGHEGWSLDIAEKTKRKAEAQLGTVGSGNHYVDLFTDEEDRVWIGVHFGSRGLGHTIASHFLKLANASDDMDAPPVVFSTDSQIGQDYLLAMELGGAYAYAGRDWVCNRVARLLGAQILESVHNHHNYAWLEEHDGEKLWVVRKGATPAFPGQRGFVGGTMCEPAVILEGVESDEARLALHSTVHGAGRVMGRKQATGVIKVNKQTGEKRIVREPLISDEMMATSVRDAGIELRGAGVDESRFCYKRLPDVLAAHAASIRILHTLTPVGVAMAGQHEFDPYKD